MIRGTALRLNRRQNQSILYQARLNNTPLQSSSTTLEYDQRTNTINMQSTQIQLVQRSSPKPMTIREIIKALEEWQDPEDYAQDLEAKERIMDCYKQRSDTLDLSYLSLSTLPDAIGKMQHIEFLSIANNYFVEIPKILGNLTALRLLNVSNNILTEVSDTIQEFKKLELFNGACNQLHYVSEELARLPKIETVILSHNRIIKFPENIHSIEELDLEDQIPPASFGKFSSEFAARWEEIFRHESGAGYMEMWVARYEEILQQPQVVNHYETFTERIGILLDTMAKNSSLRIRCYEKAQSVIATCYDGILFSLFEMEIKQVEERIIALQLSDEEVRQEMERAFNFYRLQEIALLHSQQYAYEQATTTEITEADTLETVLFFYASPENTLEMPLDGERLHYMRYPELSTATHDDVKQAEFWINYLESRYPDIIAEHTHIFMEQMEELEEKKDTIREYESKEFLSQIGSDNEPRSASPGKKVTTTVLSQSTLRKLPKPNYQNMEWEKPLIDKDEEEDVELATKRATAYDVSPEYSSQSEIKNNIRQSTRPQTGSITVLAIFIQKAKTTTTAIDVSTTMLTTSSTKTSTHTTSINSHTTKMNVSKFKKWKQDAITVAGGNGEGQQLNQLNRPLGIYIDKKKNVFIADCSNHRIIEWKCNTKEGQIIAGGNGRGNRIDQLNHPVNVIVDEQTHSIIIADTGNRRLIQWLSQNQQILIDDIDCFGLAMDKNGSLYVSDWKTNEVRRWKMGEYNNEGIIVAGANGNGSQLNQLNWPTFIFVDDDQSVYVSDFENHRVMKWRKDANEGIVVAGGNDQGGKLNQLSYPKGVIVDDLGQIYVADLENHRVIRCYEGKEEGEIVVGGNGQGNQSNRFRGPTGLSFDDEGILYVADYLNHRIQKFEVIF
ncbi:unnamed protein product [Adineta steineri]|uniref:NEL domain-containing protein n=1 Tax=Adineta steineri TaxID=433720 RepID=A0A816BJ51_9BILA|nr:unnamed protein product [Adineta steineri]CAF1608339.1 unnamed protein product [Adineta steineri]